MSRPLWIAGAAGLLLLIAGILISVIGNTNTAFFVFGLLVVGVGVVVLVSLFFGHSEDRERDRQRGG